MMILFVFFIWENYQNGPVAPGLGFFAPIFQNSQFSPSQLVYSQLEDDTCGKVYIFWVTFVLFGETGGHLSSCGWLYTSCPRQPRLNQEF